LLTTEKYKYLSREKSTGIWRLRRVEVNNFNKGKNIEEGIHQERLKMILKSELNAKNKITAIESLAIPVLRYSPCIINRD
jgi:hypothetical protein